MIRVKQEHGNILWRDASMVLALNNVVEALEMRGIFP